MFLAELNVWVDVAAAAMVFAAVFFWTVQIVGNSVSGRFKQKFRFGQWPEHDEIVPVLPRVMHFTHVTSMILLMVSGFYIRFPFYPGLKQLNQRVHFTAMYVVVIFMILRVVYAFLKDKREFLLTKQDVKIMPQALMYYMFIRKQYPHIHKYNGLQKATYTYLFPPILTLMAITGFSLMWPETLLAWSGSIGTMIVYIRVTHFFLAALITMFTLIHICLSFVEDFPALLIFFGLRRQYWEEEYDEYYEEDDTYEEEPAETS